MEAPCTCKTNTKSTTLPPNTLFVCKQTTAALECGWLGQRMPHYGKCVVEAELIVPSIQCYKLQRDR